MIPLLTQIEAAAFHRGLPAEANTAIDDARASLGSESGDGVSYEVALPGLGPEDYLLTKVLPKLVYFLDCRGVKPPGSGNVFVSIFSEHGLLFVQAGPLIELLAKARGLTLAEVVRRYGNDGLGDPLLLGG